MLCQWALGYANYIPSPSLCTGATLPLQNEQAHTYTHTHTKKRWHPGYDTKLHLIGFSFRDLGSVKCPSIAITPRSTLTRRGSTC